MISIISLITLLTAFKFVENCFLPRKIRTVVVTSRYYRAVFPRNKLHDTRLVSPPTRSAQIDQYRTAIIILDNLEVSAI